VRLAQGLQGNNDFSFDGAMILYRTGNFDDCLSACDRWLDYDSRKKHSSHWYRLWILKIKAAILLSQGDKSGALQAANEAIKIREKNSLPKDSSDDYLRKAIEASDIAAIAACEPWLDARDRWGSFAGFSEREAVLNLYPKTWKSDYMHPDKTEKDSE